MRSQQRPWVRGEFSLVRLSKANGGINGNISVVTTNTGNYPAGVVFVSGSIIVASNESEKRQRENCLQTRQAWGNILKNSPGNSLFPNEKSPPQFQATLLPASEIVSLNQLSLQLAGCITYSGAEITDIHQTGFLLNFTRGVRSDGVPNPISF